MACWYHDKTERPEVLLLKSDRSNRLTGGRYNNSRTLHKVPCRTRFGQASPLPPALSISPTSHCICWLGRYILSTHALPLLSRHGTGFPAHSLFAFHYQDS